MLMQVPWLNCVWLCLTGKRSFCLSGKKYTRFWASESNAVAISLIQSCSDTNMTFDSDKTFTFDFNLFLNKIRLWVLVCITSGTLLQFVVRSDYLRWAITSNLTRLAHWISQAGQKILRASVLANFSNNNQLKINKLFLTVQFSAQSWIWGYAFLFTLFIVAHATEWGDFIQLCIFAFSSNYSQKYRSKKKNTHILHYWHYLVLKRMRKIFLPPGRGMRLSNVTQNCE